jgi:phospholipid/cholesterol/gamma-HCH transport system substrate-binding protein
MDKHQENFKIRLGFFILLGSLLFVAAIFFIGKQKNLFDPVFRVSTTFYNVSGLQVGNNIRFSGINVGTVDRIYLINDSTVGVDMLILISAQRFIKADAIVSISSEGIIGDRLLVIGQGSTEARNIRKNQRLASTEPVETDDIVASLEVTALNIEIISGELADIVLKVNSGKGTLSQLIHDASLATNLTKTMDNLESSSKGLDENMKAVQDNIFFRGYFRRKKRDADKMKALELEERKSE